MINKYDQEHKILTDRYRKLKEENEHLKKRQCVSFYETSSRRKDMIVEGLRDLKASGHELRQKTALIARRMR